jgi:regulator of replication initiation timing
VSDDKILKEVECLKAELADMREKITVLVGELEVLRLRGGSVRDRIAVLKEEAGIN